MLPFVKMLSPLFGVPEMVIHKVAKTAKTISGLKLNLDF